MSKRLDGDDFPAERIARAAHRAHATPAEQVVLEVPDFEAIPDPLPWAHRLTFSEVWRAEA